MDVTNMEFNKNIKKNVVLRGDIYYADLGNTIGSEQGGIRPVIIVQNDVGNKFSPTVIVAPITRRQTKAKLPTHIELSPSETGLDRDSLALLEQVRTVDKIRLKEKTGSVKPNLMSKLNHALAVSMGLFM
jgi:mRNA interferase MazF